MDRTTPLIPVPLLIFLIVTGIVGLLTTRHSPRLRRVSWLFPELSVFLALTTAHLLFFWRPYRSSAQVPAGGGDLASFFYPIHAFASREVQSGRLPFWNPHQFSGMPHLANLQTGALYPPNLIAYLLSDPFSYAALERLVLLHFLLASLGGYWLARSIGFDRLISATSGAIIAYSGFMVAHLGHYPMLATAAWAPFVFASIIGTIRRDSSVIALTGTLALSMSILSGHLPMLLLVLGGAGFVAGFEIWRKTGYRPPSSWRKQLREGAIRRSLVRCSLVAVIAFGLSLPALGPAFEMTGYTARGELSYHEASEFSVEPLAFLHMILPTVFGSDPTNFWGVFSNTEIWGYAGIATLVLAVYGVLAGMDRTRLFWVGVSLVGVFYAIGPYSSIHGWLYAFVPGFDRIRGAGRAFFLVDIGLALLAGFGLRELIRVPPATSTRSTEILKLIERVLVILVAVLILFAIPLFASHLLGVDNPSNRPMIALDNLILLTIWLALSGVVIALVRRRSISGVAGVVLLGLIILIDLSSTTGRFNPTSDPILEGYDHPNVIEFFSREQSQAGPFRILNLSRELQPDAARLIGFDAATGLVDPLALENYETFYRQETSPEFIQATNVRYIVTDTDRRTPPAVDATVVLSTDRLLVWEVSDYRSRAWWVDNPENMVEVETSPSGRTRIHTDPGSQGGTLVIAQVDYPGWSAEIDGQSVSIDRYRGTLQSVSIPGGEHIIELRFMPRYWGYWVAGSIVSGAVWLGWVFYTAFRPGQGKVQSRQV